MALVCAWGAVASLRGGTFADPEYLIESWETEQGLPENSATAMVQTPDGYLWFGTFAGLVRFDGVKFTVFDASNTPELPSSGIVNLHLDGSHRLWVSTFRGVVVGEPGRWTSFHPVTTWTGDFVRMFSENAGVLCATSFNEKVFRAQAGRLEELPQPPGLKGSGYLCFVDRSGRTWVEQKTGEGYYGHWDGRWWQRSGLAAEFHPGFVGLAGLPDGRLLVLKGSELLYIDGERVASRVPLQWARPIPDGWSLMQDRAGTVWLSSAGLYRIEPSGAVRYFCSTNGLTYDSLRFAFEDRERNLWVGTSGGGLMRLKPRAFVNYGGESGLGERNVKAVLEEPDGSILVATYGRGLFRLEQGRASRLPADRQPFSLWAQCLLRDREGNLWVGSYSGLPDSSPLTVFTAAERRAIPPAESGGESVRALLQDSQERIWIGGGRTVSRYAGGRFELQAGGADIRLEDVRCFAEDPARGDIWAVGREGLWRWTRSQWREIRGPDRERLRELDCLRFAADGALWLGSPAKGLLRLQADRWSAVGEREGFPAAHVSCLLEDDLGYWWIGSNRGVIRASGTSLAAVAGGASSRLACQLFNLSDGLASTECAMGGQSVGLKDRAGRLWFSTLKGVARVDPRRLRLNTNPPPVTLEAISYLDRQGKPVTLALDRPEPAAGTPAGGPAPLVTIPAGSRQFEARFAVLSFSAPEKTRLGYRLHREGEPFVSYEGPDRRFASPWLPPGHYRLHVTAANNDAVWNETGATLAFRVEPFYWQTAWFWTLASLAAATGLAAAVARVQQNRLRLARERLKQQEALAQERARSAAFVQHTSDIIALLDAQGRVVYESPSASRLLGYPPGHMLGKDPTEFVHPEDQPRIRTALRSAFLGTNPGIPTAYRFRRADGSWGHLESLANNLLQQPGVRGVLIATRDISERQRAQEALRESEERFRTLSNASLEGIMVHDRGVILDANLAFARLFGYEDPTQLIGKDGPDLLLDEESRARIRQRMRLQETGPVEVTGIRKDGATFPGETESLPVKYLGREARLVSCRDITERKRAESERAALQVQLIQAQRLEAVGQLAGGVAHDFNNILTAMLMLLEMLEGEEDLSDEVRDRLADLKSEAHRAAALTRQLLLFSRRQVLQRRTLDLNSLLGNLLKMLRRLVGEQTVLEFHGGADELWLTADPGMIEQVVMNLVVNARDAMPKGGRIRLATQLLELGEADCATNREARPGRFACLSVTDAGCGMDEATQRRLFEPFFTTKAPGQGTGLGMATVYGIVAQHEGWIEVESALGRGSTLRVWLPAAPPRPVQPLPPEQHPPGGSETILLVEDAEGVRRGTAAILRQLGYRVLEAGDGGQALAVWAQERAAVALLLSDMVMPGDLNGLELAQRLRRDKPQLKCLLVSGYSRDLVEGGGLAGEDVAFLPKPLEPLTLAQRIRACLDG